MKHARPPGRPWTKEEKDKLKILRTQGLSYGDIARQIPGRNRSMCLGQAHRMNLPQIAPVRRRGRRGKLPATGNGAPPRSLEDREHAIDDICLIALDHLKHGWTPHEVAELLGIAAGEIATLGAEVAADEAAEAARRKAA